MKQTSHVKLHRSWFRPHTPRSVDKRGLVVALAFLVAITALAGGRGEKKIDNHLGEERPVVSTQADYRMLTQTFDDDLLKRTDPGMLTPLRQEPEQSTQPSLTVTSR